ncbi:MAG: aminopeptidase P family protein [Chloroflexi bacterium]|nr:aminopeptidase P family protein [Chloroflexota bacterium]
MQKMVDLGEQKVKTAGRVAALQAKLRQENFDGLLVCYFANRRYLSGYSASDMLPHETSGFLLITSQEAFLITSPLYEEQAQQEAPGFEVVTFGKGISFAKRIAELIVGRGLKRVGFEANAIIFDTYLGLVRALEDKAELVPCRGLVEAFRLIKEAEEIATLRRAISINDQVFNEIEPLIEPGVTEKQLAWEIERRMRDYQGEALAFETIVAGGPNGAKPHATPGERPFEPGEAVVIDMGTRYQGYNSDMTRTVCVGAPTPKFKEIYNIVLEAQLKTIEAIRPGLTGDEADTIARDLITSYGYGEAFSHSLGHGIGLAVHELPGLRKGNKETLEPNMVHSIEPGIYLSGWGGVRIEDLVLVTTDGYELLSAANKRGFWS